MDIMYILFTFKSVFFFNEFLSFLDFSFNFLHKLVDIYGDSNPHKERGLELMMGMGDRDGDEGKNIPHPHIYPLPSLLKTCVF